VPERVNRIAFVNLEGQLVTIDPNGRSQHLLTPKGSIFQFPAWSPNGSYIAAIGSDEVGAGVYITSDQANLLEPRTLHYGSSEIPIYLYWSPDSHWVSFLASHPTTGLGLYLASINGDGGRLLTTGQPFFWDWASDGNRLLIHTNVTSSDARLAFIDRKGEEQGKNLARPGLFQTPGIATNGRFWAYAEMDEFDNGQLVVASRDTDAHITVPYEGAIAFSWNPMSEQLTFISPPVAVQRFYGPLSLLDTATKRVDVLVEATVLAFFWSPNGQYIAYLILAGTEGNSDPDRVTAATTGHRVGIHTNGRTAPRTNTGQFSQDTLQLELWLVEPATGRNRYLTTFTPSPLFINQFLPFFDQYALSHHLWSPASEALALPIMDGNTPRIIIVPIDGGPLQPLAEGIMAFWSWQ